MKKLIWIVAATLILLMLAAVFLIPSDITVSKKVGIGTSQNGVVRLLTNKERWQQWWPNEQQGIVYDSSNFSYQQELAKTVLVQIPFNDTLLTAQMNTVAYRKDSSGIIFQVRLPEAANPLEKINTYFKSRNLAGNAENMLSRLKAFAEKEENIYGLAIREEKVKDSSFVALRFETTGYPDTKRIYSAIEELRQYIQNKGGNETAPPMLHANSEDGQTYQVMVAIPVNKPLEGNGKIEPKRMVLGNILVADVKGGVHTTERALESFSTYVNDRRRTSPAIPYQSLVTDRMQEPDSTKWITRLYYPVI